MFYIQKRTWALWYAWWTEVKIQSMILTHIWEQSGISFLGRAQVFLISKLCIVVLQWGSKIGSILFKDTPLPWRHSGCVWVMKPGSRRQRLLIVASAFKSNTNQDKTWGGIWPSFLWFLLFLHDNMLLTWNNTHKACLKGQDCIIVLKKYF